MGRSSFALSKQRKSPTLPHVCRLGWSICGMILFRIGATMKVVTASKHGTYWLKNSCGQIKPPKTEKVPLARDGLLSFRHSQPNQEDCSNVCMKAEAAINKICNTVPKQTDDPLHCDDARNGCLKCQLPIAECICWNIYCRQCMKITQSCTCAIPMVQRRCCSQCFAGQDEDSSLFDATFLSSPSSVCGVCGGHEFQNSAPPEYNNIDSATACSVCERVDAQETIRHCCAPEFERLLHQMCSIPAPCPQQCNHNRLLVLCMRCHQDGLEAVCDDFVFENDFIDAEAQNNAAIEAADGVMTPEHEKWEQKEIEIWMHVTQKMTNQCAERGGSVEDCLSLIDERWASAKKYIQPSLWPALQEILASIKGSAQRICQALAEQ